MSTFIDSPLLITVMDVSHRIDHLGLIQANYGVDVHRIHNLVQGNISNILLEDVIAVHDDWREHIGASIVNYGELTDTNLKRFADNAQQKLISEIWSRLVFAQELHSVERGACESFWSDVGGCRLTTIIQCKLVIDMDTKYTHTIKYTYYY